MIILYNLVLQIKNVEKDPTKSEKEDEQWNINNKILLESYEEEEISKEVYNEDVNYNYSEKNQNFYNSLDDEGVHILENAMEAMQVDLAGGKKRRSYGESSVKSEEERERHTRTVGQWPLEREDYEPSYTSGGYMYMGSKSRIF